MCVCGEEVLVDVRSLLSELLVVVAVVARVVIIKKLKIKNKSCKQLQQQQKYISEFLLEY